MISLRRHLIPQERYQMAEIIKPLLTDELFKSTEHRFFTMFQPIQKTKEKESDYVAFVVTPVLDYFVLDAIFALDVSIRLINATASLLKAAYLWTLNQQNTDSLIDKATMKELDACADNIDHILSSVVAQILNLVFSTASLVTRPVMSILEEVCDDDEEVQQRGHQHSF